MIDADGERSEARTRVDGARSGAGSVRDRYREWAPRYDHDVFEVLGVTGSARIADLLVEHLTIGSAGLEATVLDLGCGTGAVGARLAELGVRTIDGVDISPEMLAVAETKRCYRWVGVVDLGRPVSIPSAPYDASVSAGTFTTGHVGPEAIAGILRLVVPGGLLAWVIAESLWPSFRAALEQAGIVVVSADVEAIMPGGAPESVMFVGRAPSGST